MTRVVPRHVGEGRWAGRVFAEPETGRPDPDCEEKRWQLCRRAGAQTADGRTPVKGHGGGSMPVWGDAFTKSSADATPTDEKIRRLVRYLETIQQK